MNYSSTANAAAGGAGGLIGFLIALIVLAAYWRVFTKAGEAGWQAIIPIWNVVVLLKIVGRPWWWILLLLIPLVNFVVAIIVTNDLSKSFGHSLGYTIGLLLLPFIFYLMLGFGGSQYQGAAARR